ncbi:alpha/beta hydrolase [Prauserella marina]|uniref:Pimeloyl-ACP methyl ester carboxylesterase n=1 Tax=Prauserella marina TaxID=530584 RepID=A0A222VK86_9PSEU|nr:alpha/beta hydrolase [Prauserella marina]PWV71872.1 pimeloyl-ACP methyl ester carboxylesterase [Prauserella marina]SDD89750.1 Pimeloyl-ACP methyl ester carboxylesterase [Prauserella marina]
MTRPFVTSDGTPLRVEQTGPADADDTLVLVHGWTQDHRSWDRVVAELPRSIRVLRYDLRGHGESGQATPATATIDQLADDLAELIARRVPEGRLVLAGHSMGGMTIMALADRHPELVANRVEGVAFVATSCGGMNNISLGLPGFVGRGAAKAERRLAKLLVAYRREALPLRPGAVRAGARWLVFGSKPRRADVASVAEQLLCAHPASVGGFQNAISLHERRTALAALRTATTVVLAGDADRLCPAPHARAIADELPGARLVLFPGAGHMLQQERAHEVAEQLGRLLTTVRTEKPKVALGA